MMDSQIKLRVAIVGGGIAGLTMATSLTHLSSERKDIHVDIYESANQFTEIGSGVALFKRPWKAMIALGHEKRLNKILPSVPREDEQMNVFELRKADREVGTSFYQLRAPIGILGFHRAKFLEALEESIDPERCSVHFSKRLVSYDSKPNPIAGERSGIVLTFEDGSTDETDLLIGCDGINSVVRRQMLRDAAANFNENGDESIATEILKVVDPLWSGSYAYRGVFPAASLVKSNPGHRALSKAVNYMGKNKHIIAFPLPHSGLINVVAFVSHYDKAGTIHPGKTVENRAQEELLSLYEGWEDEVQQILSCIETPSRWVINNLQPLPISVSTSLSGGNVALVGDAAHAMTPHQGSGAGQAIEDAYVLSSLLAHPSLTNSNLEVALKVYETVRLPFANEVMKRSATNGRLYEFSDPRFACLTSRDISGDDEMKVGAKLRIVGLAIEECSKWRWDTDVEDDRKRAMEMLEDWFTSGNDMRET